MSTIEQLPVLVRGRRAQTDGERCQLMNRFLVPEFFPDTGYPGFQTKHSARRNYYPARVSFGKYLPPIFSLENPTIRYFPQRQIFFPFRTSVLKYLQVIRDYLSRVTRLIASADCCLKLVPKPEPIGWSLVPRGCKALFRAPCAIFTAAPHVHE